MPKQEVHLKPLGKRVEVYRKEQESLFGWLHELVGYSSVMPQYFAVLDDGKERDLRGDRWNVVDK